MVKHCRFLASARKSGQETLARLFLCVRCHSFRSRSASMPVRSSDVLLQNPLTGSCYRTLQFMTTLYHNFVIFDGEFLHFFQTRVIPYATSIFLTSRQSVWFPSAFGDIDTYRFITIYQALLLSLELSICLSELASRGALAKRKILKWNSWP